MCLNGKGKQCCMLKMSLEMRIMTHVWSERWQLVATLPRTMDGLKGVPEFRKGTWVRRVSLWRWTGKGITVSQETAIYIMYLRILQTAARSSENVFHKLWRSWVLSWDMYLLHPNFIESNPGFHRGNDNQLPRFPCLSQKNELLLAIRSSPQFPVKYTNVKPQPLMPSDFEELSSHSLKLCSSLRKMVFQKRAVWKHWCLLVLFTSL